MHIPRENCKVIEEIHNAEDDNEQQIVKISKALVLPHVKRLENETVRMLLVVVSLVCQLRELVSIV